MPYVEREDVVVERGGGGDLTGYAFVKYAFILAIVVVLLWFVATYILGR
jgi:hypothetical protein